MDFYIRMLGHILVFEHFVKVNFPEYVSFNLYNDINYIKHKVTCSFKFQTDVVIEAKVKNCIYKCIENNVNCIAYAIDNNFIILYISL